MNSTVENAENNTKSNIMNIVSGVVFVLAFVLFYSLKIAVWMKWILFLLLIAGSLAIFFLVSPTGLSLKGYFHDSFKEIRKVVWPTRKEALQFTWIVFLFVLILTLFLWAIDSTFAWVLYDFVFKR